MRSILASFSLCAVFCAATAVADDLALWTFEVSVPTTAGPYLAESGINAATSNASGFHAGTTTYSNPAGNGSAECYSSNGWAIGDYYQFQTSTVGFSGITISFDQTRSGTGPATFDVEWSTDGTTFTTLLDDYTVLLNDSSNGGTWSSGGSRVPNYLVGPIAGPAALDNQSTVYFRLTSQIAGASTGTNRVDNVLITGTGAVASGRCCYGNGFCVVTTNDDCTNTYSGTYGGDGSVCEIGVCPSAVLGACCYAADGTCQENQSAGDCVAQGGVYNGDNTTCTPNPCPQPSGACCLPNGNCAVVERDDCVTTGGLYLGNNTACDSGSCAPAAPAVITCDLAVGLSTFAAGSERLARGGTDIGTWSVSTFTQSTEFDNCGGELHNASGNLLTLDFGSPVTTGCAGNGDEGGVLYNHATDGSGLVQEVYRFNTLVGGVACTRTNGLSVSPDNSKIAVFGQDLGQVYVFDYNAGVCGTGFGASISNPRTFAPFNSGFTQGTTWEDNDNVLFVGGDTFDGNLITVFRLNVSSNSINNVVSFPTLGTGSRFCDIEYRPDIAPFIFVMQSAFTAGLSQTQLVVIDPAGPSVIKTVILDASSQTGREIAMGCDNQLVIGEYAGADAAQPKIYADTLDLDVDNDGDIDAADIAALTDNSSVDYYILNGGPDSSFNGLDVATGSSVTEPCANSLRADSNCDGIVNNFDIDCFVSAVVGGTEDPSLWLAAGCQQNNCDYVCVNDVNQDNAVNNFDIDTFVNCVVNLGCP